ncbi:MAG: class II D-tagatose-bisphosphate aldolase, non-catalytic subunit [Bacteroidales bacterium]|nr:class II D-tagatose-bisphosphate aldolase, non-catalytic subunit [Bacteroidales bacterium]MBO4565650.1 class II D-tagatose-bisphosphate aldolase, non-catalytic subunit [Bacteroidales bacterium]
MPKTEQLLHRIDELQKETGIPRTIFAACPNSPTVIRASLRAAKRNNAPIYFAATLNQIDCDGGYTGMTQEAFTRTVRFETERVNFTGPVIVAIDHGGPWLKDKQRTEKWSTEDAMNGVKKSFEAAVLAGYDLIHVDPTVDINVPKGEIIDIHVVAARTVELISHVERFRKEKGLPAISYEVGTEEVHGGLADETTFDTFIDELQKGLIGAGLPDVWPCFIVGKVGTDLDTTVFDPVVARRLTAKVRPLGSYIKGHYTDDVANPEEYPLCGMGAANVGPEFTMSEYRALCELEQLEKKLEAEGKVAVLSNMRNTLLAEVHDSHRWEKWLHEDELGKDLGELTPERQDWIIATCCRYIWQQPRTLAARGFLYDNLGRLGIDAEEVVLGRIERDMDKYFRAFNLIGLNDLL